MRPGPPSGWYPFFNGDGTRHNESEPGLQPIECRPENQGSGNLLRHGDGRGALALYEQVISSSQDPVSSRPGRYYRKRSSVLKKEIQNQKESERRDFPGRDISVFKKTLSSRRSHHPVGRRLRLERTRLMEEAARKYEKLIELITPTATFSSPSAPRAKSSAIT